MIARELENDDWFRWNGDWRVFRRLVGESKTIEGIVCVPAQPLQPTANMSGGYMPADDEVTPHKGKSIRLS
ncbi:hypothetical protein IID24_05050 [Patescibacteria group bacterium]|nr:hypothetical protein [Patescibacteria group bacterium]